MTVEDRFTGSGPLTDSASKALEGGATYPLSHRLFRVLWGLTWLVLARWTPVALHGWRRVLIRAFGGKVAATARVYPDVRIWYPPNLVLGTHSTLGPGVICYCMDQIELEDFAAVSQRAHLCGGTHDIDDPAFPLIPLPITIKRRAWVASEAFVGPGVTVGEGAVLGARSVAAKDLKSWTVYVGNPAKPVRERRRHSQDADN